MDKRSIANFLRQTRIDHGYTQEYVAEKLHIVRQAYSHYETGRHIPTNNSIFNLSRLYSIPVEVFFSLITTYYSEEEYEDEPVACRVSNYRMLDRADLNDYMEFYRMYNTRNLRLHQEELIILYYIHCIEEDAQKELILHMVKALKRTQR